MIKAWCASAATSLGQAALWRSRVWVRRSELLGDIAEWLDTSESWAAIRSRRTARHEAMQQGLAE